MSGRLSRISWNSIRFKLVVGLLAITLPTVAFLVYNNNYAIRVVHNQVAESGRSLIAMYMGQIDSQLNDVDKYMTNLIVNDADLQEMEYRTSERDRILAKIRLDNRMKSDIATFESVDSMFVYSLPNRDYIEEFRESGSMQERNKVQQYIQALLQELQSEKGANKTEMVRPKNRQRLLFVPSPSDERHLRRRLVKHRETVGPLRLAEPRKKRNVLVCNGKRNAINSSRRSASERH